MPDLLDRIWMFAGKMHPMVVHFPIALIVVALAIELLRLRRGKHDPAAAGVLCLAIGAATGVAAAAMGWGLAEAKPGEPWPLGLHRWLGVSAASVAFVGAVLGAVAARRPGPRMLGWYRLVLVCGVGLVTLAAHFGGSMVYGSDYVSGALRSLFGMAPASESGARGDEGLPEGVDLAAVDFSRDVFPILSANCFKCHAGETAKSGLRLDTRESILKGGESGKPAIVVGKSGASRLITFVSGGDPDRVMPPRGQRLTPGQISVLKAWIDQGAVWHKDVTAGERHWHWAYNPPEPTVPPKVKNAGWAKSPVDRFVLAKLEAKGLKPSGEGERPTLARRLSLDLTGLPPTPEEVDDFVNDREPRAYERLVDRLLASPRYGERWARVWLDLARYADSHGYEKDGRRVMWAYRDWLIDAYNRDEPFDRFTIDQIAGDLLPEPTLDQLVATGFHRNTQINEEGGVDPEEFRVEAMIDRANTTMSVWLGSTVGCAQCHDHKYDPFKQKDFYRLLAIFNQDEPDVAIVNSSEVRAAGGMVGVPTREKWGEFDRLMSERKKLVGAGKPEQAAELVKLEENLKQLTAAQALVMKRTAEPRVSHLFIRGSFRSPGEEVKPGVPTVLGSVSDNADRLTLAKWLIDSKNPLTARVQVNRLWAQLFGKGLVETEEDFGTQGERPTHPELLDWLATEFVKQGWSQKKMLRTIVLSATYRQSSRVTPALLEADPANKLLARGPRHRLDAEGIRDNALAAAGMLSPKMFGPSVFPPQPSGVWTQIYSGEQWKESDGEDRFRRGLYTFARRTSPYPTFTGFDAPSREVSCTRRPRTNTPLQALTTLNDPQFFEAAGALAARTLRQGGSTPQSRLAYAFRRCVARTPTKAEVDRLSKLLTEQLAESRSDTAGSAAIVATCPSPRDGLDEPELAAWTLVCNVLLNLDETLTKE
ncbi:MAG: DUF1553 domain-containing protein [Planctomycetota bacterium]